MGGGQVIADKISDSIEGSEGSIHLRKGISEVLVENGVAVGVKVENGGPEVRAKVVISNADLKRTYRDLLPEGSVDPARKEEVSKYTMGGAIFMTYLGVKCDLRDHGMRNANYWQFDGYDFDKFYDNATAGGEPQIFAAYITSASLKEPDWPHHAPDGEQNLEVMTLVPGEASLWGVDDNGVDGWKYKKEDQYNALKNRIEEELIGRLEKVFPGTTEHITFRESATPVTHTRFTRASGGSGYGLAATPDQFMKKRPGYRAELPGLYFAGANTRSGHGVLGAMLSGHQCAKRVARDLGFEPPAPLHLE